MEKQRIEVLGSEMAYVDVGEGDPIVLLHGNPTSSYLWRNVIPHVSGLGRCIAPDLIGMGDSDKVPGLDYRFVDHRRYLDAFLEGVGVENAVTLVVHDWGAALGFDWANRHRGSVAGIAYMEAIVRPVTWDDWPEASRPIFEAMRSGAGDEIVLEKNVFVERILPSSVIRQLSDDEMDEYRRPYRNPGEDRRPTLTWPREIPIDGAPEDVADIVDDYGRWLSTSDISKLFIDADPGAILVGPQREFCRNWPNQTEVRVAGSHFIQEDSPEEIGTALSRWIESR
ncbi:MAG: haloalkane dehalogenase [Actinomycetia bacterium]|nr:haloalkane dehalogenase [Actinomycetes bacterium]